MHPEVAKLEKDIWGETRSAEHRCLDQAIGNSSKDGLLVARRDDGSRMARWHCPEGRGGISLLSCKNIWAPPALGQLLSGPLPAGSFGSHIVAVWKATSPSHQLGSWPLQSNWQIPVMRCCFSASGDNGMLPFGRAGLLRGHFRNGAETESSAIFRVETCCRWRRSPLFEDNPSRRAQGPARGSLPWQDQQGAPEQNSSPGSCLGCRC